MIVITIQIVPILLVQMTPHARVVVTVPIILTTNPVMQIRIVSGVEKIKFVVTLEEGQNHHQLAAITMETQKLAGLMAVPTIKKQRHAVKKV